MDWDSAFNVYSPGDFKGLEQRALHLNEAAALRKMPFMITETNREHDFLKRLLACGAKPAWSVQSDLRNYDGFLYRNYELGTKGCAGSNYGDGL